MTCEDCGGSGQITLFTSVETCKRCGGTGWYYLVDAPDTLVATFTNVIQPGMVELPINACVLADGTPLPKIKPEDVKGKPVFLRQSVYWTTDGKVTTDPTKADPLRPNSCGCADVPSDSLPATRPNLIELSLEGLTRIVDAFILGYFVGDNYYPYRSSIYHSPFPKCDYFKLWATLENDSKCQRVVTPEQLSVLVHKVRPDLPLPKIHPDNSRLAGVQSCLAILKDVDVNLPGVLHGDPCGAIALAIKRIEDKEFVEGTFKRWSEIETT